MTMHVIFRKYVFRRPNLRFMGVNPDVTKRWCIPRSLPERPQLDIDE
jgi:hypothetical protein